MSSLIVEICKIDEVKPHENADRLEVAIVKGWHCVVGKEQFKTGDICIYIPIDSVLPEDLLNILFANTKIKPDKGRIRTIKIRGLISQGLVISPEQVGIYDYKYQLGDDVKDKLGIKKYEPPKTKFENAVSKQGKILKSKKNPLFHEYSDIENFKNYNTVFEDGESVVITEKIHGTNFRCGYVRTYPDSFWKRALSWLGLLSKKELVYGSRRVQLRFAGKNNKLFYEDNVYLEAFKKYNFEKILKNPLVENDNIIFYGEIYGEGIQKNYNYGLSKERKLVLFDLKIDGTYLDHELFEAYCIAEKLPFVPILNKGPFNFDVAKSLSQGPSVLAPTQKVREGVVIRPEKESFHPRLGRKILKLINDEYLLKDQSDFH